MGITEGKQHTPKFDYTCLDLVNVPNEGILLLYLPKYPHLALRPLLFHIQFKYQRLNVLLAFEAFIKFCLTSNA